MSLSLLTVRRACGPHDRCRRDTAVEPVPSTFLPNGPIPTGGPNQAGTLSIGHAVPLIPIVIVSVFFVIVVIGVSMKYGPRWWAALNKRRQRLPPSAQYLQNVVEGGGRGDSGWVAGAPASVGAAGANKPVGQNAGTASVLGGTHAEAGPGPSTQGVSKLLTLQEKNADRAGEQLLGMQEHWTSRK